MKVSFQNVEPTTASSSSVAFLITSDSMDSPSTPLEESLFKAAKDNDFKAKAGDIVCFPSFGMTQASKIFLVGTGSEDDDLRRTAGAIGHAAREQNVTSVSIFGVPEGDHIAEIFAGALAIGNYRFDKYKAEKDQKSALSDVVINGPDASEAAMKGVHLATARNLARDLVNEPADVIYPESLAEVCLSMKSDTMSVDIWDEHKIKAEGMGGITAVGQGSSKPARFIHMHYKPKGDARKTLVFVGKGVTFDSGGLSLKSSAGMQTMRCDMGGAGSVVGTMKALTLLQPDVEVHGIVGAVENMCAANSYKLGDILSMYNGKNVEVHNTDAEGRLVLADCLTFGDRLGADAIVDLATLTGACVVALGDYYAGLFTNADEVAEGLSSAAGASGEGLWRMPLPDFYKPLLKAEWGQIKNVGGRAAGSITAALFLSEFVEDTPWAHIDIAGPGFLDKKFRHMVSGATGTMVETLYRWINS